MIQYTDSITPEEYMELRKKVGWTLFPLEEARNCIENAYLVICVRDGEKQPEISGRGIRVCF